MSIPLHTLSALAVLMSFAFSGTAHAFEFDYIQTEKFYNTRVREIIEKEYFVAKSVLEAQATTLGVNVRETDVRKLKTWMREKAFLYALCLDRAIRVNSDNDKIDLESYSVNCVKDGLRIADQVQRKAWSELVPRPAWPLGHQLQFLVEDAVHICLGGQSHRVLDDKYVFDFLRDNILVYAVLDYHLLKECISKKASRLGIGN
jgi:hypothetical protein